jgi:hypothetical protein
LQPVIVESILFMQAAQPMLGMSSSTVARTFVSLAAVFARLAISRLLALLFQICKSSGIRAKKKDIAVLLHHFPSPVILGPGNVMNVEYTRKERKIGRTGPKTSLNPAHPTPAIAFMSNCRAQQEEDKRGKSSRRINRDNDEDTSTVPVAVDVDTSL